MLSECEREFFVRFNLNLLLRIKLIANLNNVFKFRPTHDQSTYIVYSHRFTNNDSQFV